MARFDESIRLYNAALEMAYTLRQKIQNITQNNVYLLACQREARAWKEKRKDRWMLLWAAIAGGVVGSFLTFLLSVVWKSCG